MRWLRVAAAAAILSATGALVAWPAGAAQKDVSIKNTAFNPASVMINVGDSVKWTNNETVIGANHNVFSDETPQFRSGQNLAPGDMYTFTFGAAGTFSYYCTIHGKANMSGVVISQAPPTSTTLTTVRPTTTTTARATTTTRRVTTTVESTTTTLEEATTTTEETTSTTEAALEINEDDGDGGVNGGAVALLVAGILAVLGGGGYLLYRMRAGRF